MFRLLRFLVGPLCPCFRSRKDLLLENLALRQQLSVFKRRKQRLKLAAFDRLFWIGINKIWTKWKGSLVMVTPETVVGLASGRISQLLALALPLPGRPWPKANQQGTARTDFPDGRRESYLGCASDSR